MTAQVLAKTLEMPRDEWLEWQRRGREEWKDVPGFEGLYKVSNYGRVYSCPRCGTKGGILKQCVDRYGYLKVILYRNGKPYYFKVHRLVAMAFIPNLENKPTVNHKDNNRQNNMVDNLEWTTMAENLDHSHKQKRQVHNKMPIIAIHKSGEVRIFESQREAARQLNLCQRHIHNVLYRKNRMKTHKGWCFKYA